MDTRSHEPQPEIPPQPPVVDLAGEVRAEFPVDAILLPRELPVLPAPPPPPMATAQPARTRTRSRIALPVGLFIATCLSTYLVGGPIYALSLMTILVCHEAGHWLQARRCGVPASLPYFIPIPFTPIGTMGAVIAMEAGRGNRRELFDIGITGPLAGLVPTLIFCVLGIAYGSEFATVTGSAQDSMQLGEPLVLQWLTWLIKGPAPSNHTLFIGPMAMAGWVGLLITSLNLIPIGQLDGGHVLYALLRKKAHIVAQLLMAAAFALVLLYFKTLGGWTLMLIILMLIGPIHPPTANDNVPLGPVRVALGWLTLAFVIIGFTPQPFIL